MGRLCERPGCSETASIAFGFDADRLLVWLAVRDPAGDPNRAGSLCGRHADAMVVPLGWTLDDRRDPTPRLFRPRPTGDVVRTGRRPRRAAASGTHGEQLTLAGSATVETVRTVADVAGASVDDPDATVAIPWVPEFDERDDLDGVLAADTPLLARAFLGTDRRR